MNIQIPDNFRGKPIQGSMEKVLAGASKPTGSQNISPNTSPIRAPSSIKPADYITIPQYPNVLIAKEISFKGKNWQDTHYELAGNGLFMPRIDHMMAHFMNVQNADQGATVLYDGNNNQISKNETRELWDYLSSTSNRPKGVCWTWLDALFKTNSAAEIYMITDNRVSLSNGQKKLSGMDVILDDYIQSDGWANLSFNKQGLATKKSSNSSYAQGKNIYFWYPRDSCVARFDANSDGADLDCNWYPTYTDSSLGVFACAEGTPQKNSP